MELKHPSVIKSTLELEFVIILNIHEGQNNLDAVCACVRTILVLLMLDFHSFADSVMSFIRFKSF